MDRDRAAWAWAAGGFLAVASLALMPRIRPGFWAPVFGAAIGAGIGGAAMPSASRVSIAGCVATGLAWGGAFFVCQTIAFYVAFQLMEMTVDLLVPVVGHVAATAIPFAIVFGGFGYAAPVFAAALSTTARAARS